MGLKGNRLCVTGQLDSNVQSPTTYATTRGPSMSMSTKDGFAAAFSAPYAPAL
jgi:hypothetical protein